MRPATATGTATAIVTGGGRGIGEAVARALTARGLAVTVFARTGAELERVVAQGGAALAVIGDVTDEADVARLLAEHQRRLGPCHLLVNNAGVLVRGAVDALAPAEIEATLTMRPWRRAFMPGNTARAQRNGPVKLTSSERRHSAGARASTAPRTRRVATSTKSTSGCWCPTSKARCRRASSTSFASASPTPHRATSWPAIAISSAA